MVDHMIYQAERLQTETMFYWNPKEAWKILKSPSAAITLMSDVINLGETIISFGWFDTYEGGRQRGQSVMLNQIMNLAGPIPTVKKVFFPEEQITFFN